MQFLNNFNDKPVSVQCVMYIYSLVFNCTHSFVQDILNAEILLPQAFAIKVTNTTLYKLQKEHARNMRRKTPQHSWT